VSKDVLVGDHFLSGDVAAAEGAIAAGCRFFAGYPITPSSEVAERMARRLPEVGGIFIQMEDELASIAAILGASWGGKKAMTATSGPGFSLMMENYGLGMMTETPAVIIDVQRGGPSTGLPTLLGQGDVMQARWGSHGPYQAIALTPESGQEIFDLTIRAFNLAEKYRQPVVVLMDESLGHLFEKVTIPPKEDIEIIDRKVLKDKSRKIYEPDEDLIPPMPPVGEGFGIHVTGLTHDERGYPNITAEVQERVVGRINEKIKKHAHEIIDYEEFMVDDAEVIVVAYGITARSARRAVIMAREEGIKAGLFRFKVIWPFPSERLEELSDRDFVVAEVNNGQALVEVERAIKKKAVFVGKMGGEPHRPEEILKGIKEALK
jgi:2-oxoglutarate ferredoxin oxidoreductase subunit alpha